MDPKEMLRQYLQLARDVLIWKLDGLSEYDLRRPVTPTGTNLLGLVKHLTGIEFGYFGEAFGRPSAGAPEWLHDRNQVDDMYARADESREQIVGMYRQSWAHADSTIAALDLEATGRVSHWPEGRREVTLHWMLVHVITETYRHAGHADIVRELVDGAAGYHETTSNLPAGDRAWWAELHTRVESAAREAAHFTRSAEPVPPGAEPVSPRTGEVPG